MLMVSAYKMKDAVSLTCLMEQRHEMYSPKGPLTGVQAQVCSIWVAFTFLELGEIACVTESRKTNMRTRSNRRKKGGGRGRRGSTEILGKSSDCFYGQHEEKPFRARRGCAGLLSHVIRG